MAGRGGGAGQFVVCISKGEDDVDLVVGKVYRVVRARRNDGSLDIRIVDESGEDYLYARDWFAPVELSLKAKKALVATR